MSKTIEGCKVFISQKINSFIVIIVIILFASCGGSGDSASNLGSGSDISGKVVDGYISNAIVTINNKTTKTNAIGAWSISGVTSSDNTYITAMGGTDISTGELFDTNTTLKSMVSNKSNFVIISPLTTLVAEVKLADSTSSLADIEQKISTNLGLDVDTLKADPIALLSSSDKTKAQKALKAIFLVQKFAESYNALDKSKKISSKNGLFLIAEKLINDKNISAALEDIKNNDINDTNATKIFNVLKIQLDSIKTKDINSTSLTTLSKAIEIATSKIESSLSENNISEALKNAKMLAVTGIKVLVKKVEENNTLDASDYANTFFENSDTKTKAIALYDKIEDLVNDTNLTLNDILLDIATQGNVTGVINQKISESNKTDFNMSNTIADFNSSLSNILHAKDSDIIDGYYEKVVYYDGINDANFTVNLPQGTFYIVTEYSGSDKSTQVEFGALNTIKDEDGNNPTDSNITSGNLRTNSSAIAKLTIKNNSSSVKTYVIPVRAYQGTSDNKKASKIWVAALNYDTNEIKNTKQFTLKLNDNSSNTGEVLVNNSENFHIWQFKTNATQDGTYDLEITTDYDSYRNPLQYFKIILLEGTQQKQLISAETNEGILTYKGISINSNTTYKLKLIPLSPKSDAYGYYTIKLNKRQ